MPRSTLPDCGTAISCPSPRLSEESMAVRGGAVSRRRLLQAGLGSLVALDAHRVFAADALPSDALIAAARKEGTLTYYTSSEIDMVASWSAEFTRSYGVQVKAVRGPSYPMFDRWLNEERVGRHFADVVQISDPTLLAGAFKQGFVVNYIPAADAAIYPGMKQSGVWYASRIGYMGIAYNTQRTTADDEQFLHAHGWDALTDPRWKGRCATTAAASGGSTYAYDFMFMVGLKDRFGTPFLEKWAANKPDIYISKPPLFDRLVAGQYAIADEATAGDLNALFLKGAPVRWLFPDPTPAVLTCQSISAHAPHPNAARLFTEWSLGVAGQTAWLAYESVGPSRPDVVDPRKTNRQAWFDQPWYSDPKTLYLDYLTNPAFADPAKPLIAEWNTIFGYDGAGQ
jgi:ABC-type Fe3+ transport system substrate-binding protein